MDGMSTLREEMKQKIVVSQSMYFPWVGLLEQVRLADVFVHYDDVQYSKGFFNRVQIKGVNGTNWITVPLKKHDRSALINEVEIDYSTDWQTQHRRALQHNYQKSPFVSDLLRLVDSVFSKNAVTLAELSCASILELTNYFQFTPPRFLSSHHLNVAGSSSQRLCEIVSLLNGDVYITGHGAKKYLDHELFERHGISVQYMDYKLTPYPQLYGSFTPYVSALDLVGNCGVQGADVINSGAIDWRKLEL